MQLQYRPLPAIWPSGQRTPISQRRRSPFKAGWPNTLDLLERELRHLGVGYSDRIVIEAGFQEHEIRLDGYPRANARPHDPAIVISFESRWGPLRYGCDTYEDHQSNVRAIALSLEALRSVDRHGVTKRGEQYAGWMALPAPGESETAREAERFIRQEGGLGPDAALEAAYKAAAKRLYPDMPTGNRELWDALQRARGRVGL